MHRYDLQVPPQASAWIPSGFTLPVWSSHMCLMEYVPLLVAKVQGELQVAARALEAKQQVFGVSAWAEGF